MYSVKELKEGWKFVSFSDDCYLEVNVDNYYDFSSCVRV